MDEIVKRLKDDPDFNELTRYVVSEIDRLSYIDGVEKMSNAEAGEEVKIRYKARERLLQMFRPFIEYSEKKTPTDEEIKAAEKRVGL